MVSIFLYNSTTDIEIYTILLFVIVVHVYVLFYLLFHMRCFHFLIISNLTTPSRLYVSRAYQIVNYNIYSIEQV